MTPGPTLIYECPHCQTLGSKRSINSGNTLGSLLWSDGYRHSPMLPDIPDLHECPECRKPLWTSKQEPIVEEDDDLDDFPLPCSRRRSDGPGGPRDATDPPSPRPSRILRGSVPPLVVPKESGYYRALGLGLAESPADEAELRVRAWWKSNDRYRKAEHGAAPHPLERSDRWRKNLEAMLGLCDHVSRQYPLRAEALRELARFDEALEDLDRTFPRPLMPFVERLRTLCRRRNHSVVLHDPA
jgi:hypothetical protein